jgi:hypothetical protein
MDDDAKQNIEILKLVLLILIKVYYFKLRCIAFTCDMKIWTTIQCKNFSELATSDDLLCTAETCCEKEWGQK